jgi:heme/copper-type cytochrome/quinol oxidase subunit 2
MWGNLITETSFISNFEFGFPTKQSDILLHLTHWQYWFWFWFTYYMVLYYFIFLRLIRYRVLKMSPKLATSFRSHGKWGDLLVCFIPLSWCTNILSNSNFILRMIEWQSESSLFTLRVRGKQWYWVYKFELKSLVDISETSKNVGSNFWVNMRSPNKHHFLGLLQSKHNLSENHLKWMSSGEKQFVSNVNPSSTTISSNHSNSIGLVIGVSKTSHNPQLLNITPNNYNLARVYNWRAVSHTLHATPTAIDNLLTTYSTTSNTTTHPFITRTDKIRTTAYTPLRLSFDSNSLKLRFTSNSAFTQKPASSNFYLVIKQKRYAPSSMISNKYTLSGGSFTPNHFKPTNMSFISQHNAIRSELPSVQSNRRLLRTRRVLVLPAHTNITLITNSFDVMHSWYIPGLGVKLDCVPGRSTHHTIHIDHAGFYYGQCAEICGRYHHHMPIRVCALPFEHFLVWWYHYGVPFFLAGNQNRESFIGNTSRQINW